MAPITNTKPKLSKSTSKVSDEKGDRLKGKIKKNKSKLKVPLGYSNSEDEARLEKLVLGENSSLFTGIEEAVEVFKVDTEGDHGKPEAKPAWEDPDPSEITGNRVKTFQTLAGNPLWAKLDRKHRSSDSDDEDNEIERHAGNLLSRSTIKHASLVKGTLDYKRNLDLNSDSERTGMIKAVEFHPGSAVALVADTSGIAALYEVNGRTNPKLHSIKFGSFPISCAKFASNGTDFLVGSQFHSHMFCYDMESGTSIKVNTPKAITNFKNFRVSPDGSLIAVVGRFGDIHLLTANTKEVVGRLKMNGEAKAISFNSTGSLLYSHGDEGEVYVWDVNARKCVERFLDAGCLTGNSLATSSQYVATGCSSGAVNVYSTAAAAAKRTPLKTLLNLVTPVTGLAFNGSEEMLAMSSYHTPNAIRLVHLPSFTVFSNFPGREGERQSASSRRLTQCISFSPNGGYLAIGDNVAQVSLFRLKHYGNY